MALPEQGCCWPVQLERWALPGRQQVSLAWPVLVLQQQVWQLAWRLVSQQQVWQLAWRLVLQRQVSQLAWRLVLQRPF